MKDGLAWVALLLLSFILILASVQGSAGKLIAVAFVPSILEIHEG